MKHAIVLAGLVTVAGCGGGSVEHEYIESSEFSGQRTKIHVRSHDEPSGGYRVVKGQPVHVHVHAGGGRTVCIEMTTD